MGKAPYRKVVPSDQYFAASSKYSPKYESCGVLFLGGNTLNILFKTDNEVLMKMWRENFPQSNNLIIPDGTIEVYGGEGDSIRLYDKANHRMLITNNAYYGCVKFGYRVICSDLIRSKNIVSLHSGAVVIKNKMVLITGPSGSGKNTTFTYLDQKHDGLFLWDDWGVVSMLGDISLTNEIAFHMSETSIRSIVGINDLSGITFEDRENKKYMVPVSRYRQTAMHVNTPKRIDCLVILTNWYDTVDVRNVSKKEAYSVFSQPAYSFAWDCKVPFVNEHLMMSNDELMTLGIQYKTLFDNVPRIIVANNNKQEKDKMKFLVEVEKHILE